jgi:CHAT domain-containing protein
VARRSLRLALALASIAGPSTAAEAAPESCAILREPLEPSASSTAIFRAESRLARCLAAARAAGARSVEAEALAYRAELRALAGDWRGSLAAAQLGIVVARTAGSAHAEGRSHNAAGDALLNLWRFEEGLEQYEGALLSWEAADDLRAQATTLKNLGIAHALLGRRDLALVRLEAAMERYPAWEEGELGVSLLGNLGTIYYRLGAPRSAARAYQRALGLARTRGRSDEIADLLGRIGYLDLWLGRPELARERFREALAAAAEAGPTAELPLLLGASAAHDAAGDWREAERALERLLAHYEPQRHAVGLCLALTSLAALHEQRDPERAHSEYRRAEAHAERAGPACRWPALAGIGRLAARAGERDAAIEALSGALAAVEARWRRLVSESERRTLTERSEPSVRQLASLLVERARDRDDPVDLERAFGALERARGALVTRAIAEAGLELPTDLPVEQAKALRALVREIRALGRGLESSAAGEADLAPRAELLARREAELDEHLRNLRRAPVGGDRARWVGAGEAKRLLPPGAALVCFLLGEDRSLAFVLTASDLRVVDLPARRARVSEAVESFADLLRDERHGGWRAVGHRLYRDLIEPWEGALGSGVETLLVVPDRELRALSFAALPRDRAGRSLLADRFAVALVPSATALAELTAAASSRAGEVWIFADPWPTGADAPPSGRLRALYEEDGHRLGTIPSGRVEAKRIQSLAGSAGRLFQGRDASEARLKSPSARPRVALAAVHFATHAVLTPADPSRSALLLGADPTAGEDGFLQAREIEALRLPAELVVLAACRSARGQPAGGEAVESLAEAFFRAGARTVVGTLWDVDDDAAMRLMTLFYGHLAAGAGKAEALRRAQLELRARAAAPGEWAGFVLLGEPVGRVPLAGRLGGLPVALWSAALGALLVLALPGALVRLRRRRRLELGSPRAGAVRRGPSTRRT